MDNKNEKKEYKFHQDCGILYTILFIVISQTVITLFMIIDWRIGEKFGGTIISILSIILVSYFTSSKLSNKIILSKEGIRVQHFKKQISFIKWNELENASIIMKYNIRYISLKIIDSKTEIQDETIELNISNRKLSYLRRLCTNSELKLILKNKKLNNFFCYY